MKTFLSLIVVFVSLSAANAQRGVLQDPPPPARPPEPPAIHRGGGYVAPAPVARDQQVYVYEQRVMGGRPYLVTQDQAQEIIDRFKSAYPKLGSPRFLIYVNRELVDEQSGLKLTHRREQLESSRSSGTNDGYTIKSTSRNNYRVDGKAAPTLADRQTVRDVERLFGRPLRAGGASLADQKVASQLIADRPVEEFIGTSDSPQARKDREALGKIADVVIEVLIGTKKMTVQRISSTETVTVPDINATAIRLNDSKILAQASSSDVMMRISPAQAAAFDVREIAEATALELMEDMSGEE